MGYELACGCVGVGTGIPIPNGTAETPSTGLCNRKGSLRNLSVLGVHTHMPSRT